MQILGFDFFCLRGLELGRLSRQEYPSYPMDVWRGPLKGLRWLAL